MSIVTGQPAELEDTKLLRSAFGTFATGITVVTVGGATPHGMTANSFASVSLDPPLVLVCIGREAIMHQVLDETAFFGISVLAVEQEAVARHFANRWRPLGAAQFDAVSWRPGRRTGTPMIAGALASFECERWRTYDGGDHTIFIGRVLGLERQPDQNALLFFDGRFRQVRSEPSEPAA